MNLLSAFFGRRNHWTSKKGVKTGREAAAHAQQRRHRAALRAAGYSPNLAQATDRWAAARAAKARKAKARTKQAQARARARAARQNQGS